MTNNITDADRAAAERFRDYLRAHEVPTLLFVDDMTELCGIIAAHRLSAVAAREKEIVQILIDFAGLQEHEAMACDVEGDDDAADVYRHSQGEIERLIELIKTPSEGT